MTETILHVTLKKNALSEVKIKVSTAPYSISMVEKKVSQSGIAGNVKFGSVLF